MKSYTTERSDRYERWFAPWLAPWTDELINVANPHPGERILDIACGTGTVARTIADRLSPSAHITGVDLNASMVEVAQDLVPVGIKIAWETASADSLPFSDDSFDLAVCQQGFQFFPDRLAALREANRVLRPGGRITMSVWTSIEQCPVQLALAEALDQHLGRDVGENMRLPFACPDAETLRTLLTDAGFRDVSLSTQAKTLSWPSVRDYVHRYVSITPAADAFEAATEQTRDAVVEIVADRSKDLIQNGELLFPTQTNLVCAST